MKSIYEKMLLKKLCYSIFKYEGKILKVKKIDLKDIDSIILNIFNNILKSENMGMYFSDKVIIVQNLNDIVESIHEEILENHLKRRKASTN